MKLENLFKPPPCVISSSQRLTNDLGTLFQKEKKKCCGASIPPSVSPLQREREKKREEKKKERDADKHNVTKVRGQRQTVTQRQSAICVTETLFSHLRLSRRDVWGHVTTSLQVAMARDVWTEDETEYFSKSATRHIQQPFLTINKHNQTKTQFS